MRLLTCKTPEGATRAAVREGEVVRCLPYPDVASALADAVHLEAGPRAARGGESYPLDEVELLPPVPAPGKIVCLGLNWHSHVREVGRDVPRYPTLFAKFTEALIGPRAPIQLPRVSTMVDWEAEVAVVVGRTVRYVDERRATAAIAGFAVLNDVTARDWQTRTRHFLQGKTFDRTTPFGPWIVTLDEIDDWERLRLTCTIDGEVVQDEQLAGMVWSPAELVSYISHVVTLQPGDVIAAGTPAGVGRNRTPPRFLEPGQRVVTELSEVGELDNVCISEDGGVREERHRGP